MGDYEAVPADWGWLPSATVTELDDAVGAAGGRLIAVHRPDGGPEEPYSGVWVVDQEGQKVDWDWTHQATAAKLDSLVTEAKGRIIAIDPFTLDGEPVFTAVWVLGDTASSVEWGWDADLTAAGVRKRAAEGRLICLSPYLVGGSRRYVAVWVVDGRRWDWDEDIDFESLRERLHDFPGRLVSLDPFLKGNDLRFAAVWVDAEDEFIKSWWWEVGPNAETVSMNAELFCSHLVEARRIPGWGDSFAHFRYGFPRSPYEEGAKLVRVTGDASLDAITDYMPPFDQTHTLKVDLINISGEKVEILEADFALSICGWSGPWDPAPLFDQFFPGASTTMPAAATYSGTITQMTGPMPTHYVVRVRAAAADGRTQLLHAAIPILRTNFAAPEQIEVSVPVYLGLWTRPMEVVPVWKEGEIVNWLTVGGVVVNNTGQTLRIGGLHLSLEAGDDILDERELNLGFHEFSSDFTEFSAVPPPATAAHAELPSRFSYFVDGFALPKEYDPASPVEATLVLNYKLMDGWCGAAIVKTTALHTKPVLLGAPVRGEWFWGNSAMHSGFDAHAWPGQRFALDMTKRDDSGSTLMPFGDPQMNESYYAYGEPVYAVAKGTVLVCEFGQTAENDGNKPADPPATWPGNNWVLLSHDTQGVARRSGYYHLRSIQPDPDKDMQPGDPIEKGQLIGYVGNIGASSEPHLHWGWAEIDSTGRCRTFPVRPRGLKTPDGEDVTSVPADGNYVS